MKPIKVWYKDELWADAEVEGFAFMRPEPAMGTVFSGFRAGRGSKAKATLIKLDDVAALQAMMVAQAIEWRHLSFEIDRVLFQLVKYVLISNNTLNECSLTMLGPVE